MENPIKMDDLGGKPTIFWKHPFEWKVWERKRAWWTGLVVSNIFYFQPYLGKWSNMTNILQMGWNHQLDDKGPQCDIREILFSPQYWIPGTWRWKVKQWKQAFGFAVGVLGYPNVTKHIIITEGIFSGCSETIVKWVEKPTPKGSLQSIFFIPFFDLAEMLFFG